MVADAARRQKLRLGSPVLDESRALILETQGDVDQRTIFQTHHRMRIQQQRFSRDGAYRPTAHRRAGGVFFYPPIHITVAAGWLRIAVIGITNGPALHVDRFGATREDIIKIGGKPRLD